MANYDQLSVYRTSYDLFLAIFQFSKNMEREYKYTIGENLKKETTELITAIYRANANRDKKELIRSARERIEVIRLYIRLLKDLKQISLLKFITINELIESISKQLHFWEKSV